MGCIGEIIIENHQAILSYPADPSPGSFKDDRNQLHSVVCNLSSAVKQLSDLVHVQAIGHEVPDKNKLALTASQVDHNIEDGDDGDLRECSDLYCWSFFLVITNGPCTPVNFSFYLII